MYDIIIIGAGPAGLTAGIYGAQANKKVLILEKMGAGGQVANINEITNYPGFVSINGFELSEKMKEQAKHCGAEIKREEVIFVDFSKDIKLIKTHKEEYGARNVIIASGAYAKPLELDNEKEFLGKGLSYCATCDGNFFKNKTVVVVGGGNTSMDDCLYLSGVAKKVYLIHRRDEFRASEHLLNKVKALTTQNVEIITNSVVTKILGNEMVTGIEIYNKKDNKTKELLIDGLFVAIGRKPDTEIFNNLVELNNGGFIKTDERMRTSIKGVYAIGDVRETPLRQIVTACGDGAIAVNSILIDRN